MSGRGRGRGFGRGRGGAPDIKDDDGQYVTRDVSGPPPLFPEGVELPTRKDHSQELDQMKTKWRALTSYWKKSPYHLKLSETKSGVKRSLEDFLGDAAPRDGLDTTRLAKVLTLHPRFFPEELYTTQEKRASSRAATLAGQKEYWAAMNKSLQDTSGMSFDRLARLEAMREENADKPSVEQGGEKAAAGEGGEEEEAEEEVEADEPDEDDFEDDDYLQGQDFDDDEGYDDGGDDGDDGGGAYY